MATVIVRSGLSGMKELQKWAEEFPKDMQKDVYNQVLNETAKPIVRAARANAPRSARAGGVHLADTIIAGRRVSRTLQKALGGRPKGAFIAIGPDFSKVKHGHLIEFGHVVLARGPGRKTGPKPGKQYRKGQAPKDGKSFVEPRPFMRPAWDQIRPQFDAIQQRAFVPSVEKVLRKYQKQVKSGKLTAKTLRTFRVTG